MEAKAKQTDIKMTARKLRRITTKLWDTDLIPKKCKFVVKIRTNQGIRLSFCLNSVTN